MAQVTIIESAAPATPGPGYVVVYVKTDGKLYFKDDAGVETQVASVAGSATQAFSASTLTAANVPVIAGTAPVYACRAWVNFNGTGTVAIRASGNVSSITDNAVGDYKVNFTTAMPDANYAVTVNARTGGGAQSIITVNRDAAQSASACPIYVVNPSTPLVLQDESDCHIAIFR